MNRKARRAARRLGAQKVGADRGSPQRSSGTNPRTPDALTNIGRVLLHDGRPQEAADYFVRALQDAPESPALHTHLGAALATGGNLVEALNSFQTALRLDPDFTVARASISEI